MASHYEQFQSVQGTGSHQGQIDFYRQSDSQQQFKQNNNIQRGSMIQQQQQQTYSASQKNFQDEGSVAQDNNFQVDDASPITGLYQTNNQYISNNGVNYQEGYQMQQQQYENYLAIEEAKRQMIMERQANAASNSQTNKRRSVESREAITGIRQRDLLLQQDQILQNNNQNVLGGVRSALGYYGNEQQQQQQQTVQSLASKQNGKITKIDSNQDYNNQHQRRTLAKSQSQNRLLLVSPDTLMNKNNPYQEMYNEGNGNNQNPSDNKNSFYKDPVAGRLANQPSDLLYKQHMQYSSGAGVHHKSWQLKASNQNNHLLSGMTTKSECTYCNKTGAGWGGVSSTIIPPHQCSAIYCSKDQQGMMIQNNLSKKYSTNRDYYNLKIVNDLIYNENTHIVSIFKDYLILDDINEFLKRSYNQQETKVRLPKLCSFYDKYSQVFPNYVCLPESKYMFKNIQRKQKLIDEQYQLQEELAKKQHQSLLDDDKLFNTKFYNSYYSNMGDISMTKKQYEEQAKQIATQAGKKIPTRTAIEQMRIDELVDRFLMKDSESNIQLITTAGLDFSGFTQGNSTFINNTNQNQEKNTPKKQSNQKVTNPSSNNKQNIRAVQQQNALKNQNNQINKAVEKKPSTQTVGDNSKKMNPQQALNLNAGYPSMQAINKKQKGSFNNNQALQQQQKNSKVTSYPGAPKLDGTKMAQNAINMIDSNKNTPRLQKANFQNVQILQTQEVNSQNLKQMIQTSPGTKEALQNYLNNHQLEDTELMRESTVGLQSLKLNVNMNEMQKTQNLAAMGSLLSPASQNNPTVYSESPYLRSPPNQLNQINKGNGNLVMSGSQTALMTQQQLLQANMNNRANLRSQLINPQINNNQNIQQQQVNNVKKIGRLSNPTTHIKQQQQRKNISPLPSNQNQLQTQDQHILNTQHSSRNLQIANNSTQKSGKSINSHAKYLSGGSEQYQKLLLNINNNQNNNQNAALSSALNQQQNSYVTNYETVSSNIFAGNGLNAMGTLSSSSTKKHLQKARSKGTLPTNNNNGGVDNELETYTGSQGSLQKNLLQNRHLEFISEPQDNDLIPVDDCDDFGIADERFASPNALGELAINNGTNFVATSNANSVIGINNIINNGGNVLGSAIVKNNGKGSAIPNSSSMGMTMVYQTVDEIARKSVDSNINNNMGIGKNALSIPNPQQMLLLTNSDENSIKNQNAQMMMLSQYDNFEQIKKHLEQQCISNKKNQLQQDQQQFNYDQMNSLQSHSKQHQLKQSIPSEDKKSSVDSAFMRGDFMTQSVISNSGNQMIQNSNNNNINMHHHHTKSQSIHSNSNINHAHKISNGNNFANSNSNDKAASAFKQQYESIKQQIRGVYQQSNNTNNNNNNFQSSTDFTSQGHLQSKTPNKASTHSKKQIHNHNQQQQQQQLLLKEQQQQQMISAASTQQLNRMSLETANMMLLLPNTNPNTVVNSANNNIFNGQRQMSFSQTSFSSNNNANSNVNYRSITNLQQRKGGINVQTNGQAVSVYAGNKDNSVEKKRLSQNRQSFKELTTVQQVLHQQQQIQQQQNNSTALNDQQKVIKRSITSGKTLNIYETNSNSTSNLNPAVSYLQSVQNNASLLNPTFISNSNNGSQHQTIVVGSSKFYNTNHNSQQQQQIQQQYQQQQQQAANTVRVMTPSYSLASLSKAISPTQMKSQMTMTVTLAQGQNQAINRKQIASSNKTKTALGVHQSSQGGSNLQSMLVQSHSQNYLHNNNGVMGIDSKSNSKLITSNASNNNQIQKNNIQSKANAKNMVQRPNSTVAQNQINNINGNNNNNNNLQITSTQNQKLIRQQLNNNKHLQQQNHPSHILQQSSSHQNLQSHTPKSIINLEPSSQYQNNQNQHNIQFIQQQKGSQPTSSNGSSNNNLFINSPNMNENFSQNVSCTLSTDNNSSKYYLQANLTDLASKALESKNPKFMSTIEEFTGNVNINGGSVSNAKNNVATRKSGGLTGSTNNYGIGLTNSSSQSHLDSRHQKQKIQTVVNSNQASIKRNHLNSGQILSQSASVSHFKSSSQQMNNNNNNNKKQQQQLHSQQAIGNNNGKQ